MLIKKTYVLLSFLSMSLLAFCFCKPMLDTDEEREKLIVKNTRNTLTYLHYKPATVDDKFSENVFNKYLEYIDPSKRFLLQSDYDLFKKDYHNLDDYYKSENLGFYNSTVDTIYKRIAEAEKYSMDALSKPFDFNQKENFNIDYKTSKFAKDKNEAKDLWRKYLKYNVMLARRIKRSKERYIRQLFFYKTCKRSFGR